MSVLDVQEYTYVYVYIYIYFFLLERIISLPLSLYYKN